MRFLAGALGFVRKQKPGLIVTLLGLALLVGAAGIYRARHTTVQAAVLQSSDNELIGRAVLNAASFAQGPTSGTSLGSAPLNGVNLPFNRRQPIQGFSAVLMNGDGTYNVMCDNGYGSIENSADFNLRVYTVRPDFKTRLGGSGNIRVLSFIELCDPDQRIPFAITNQFTRDRVLTGADFDLESMQRGADGTLWFGDEFGPFLLHTDARGRMMEPPIPLPDFEKGGEIRSPQNPFNEEASALRIMNAVRQHARAQGNTKAPVFSPWHVMLDDNNADTFIDNRQAPPAGSGLKPASSDVFNVRSLQSAGYPVVVWTVNDKPRMLELMRLGVNGIISDRPDLLRQAAEEFDANSDGKPGDFLTAEGLIDISRFDAQGHRGGRNLRPENTIPAMEVAFDSLVTTLELDTGITLDGVPVLNHDPTIQSEKARRADGSPYNNTNEVRVRDLTLEEIQRGYIADKLFRGPDQKNDAALSPVSVAFAASIKLPHIYAMPALQQVFDFAKFYVEYYRNGAGRTHADAERRWKNAARIRYNIETKINPRREFARLTINARPFARTVAEVIAKNSLEDQADIQSFDFRTLLEVQRRYPRIRTVYLFGDFPIFSNTSIDGSDDGTNLQDEFGDNTPWLAGLYWPYRQTRLDRPFRAQRSGGFEGMAISPDRTRLYPLLELPLTGGEANTLLIHEFDIAKRAYTGARFNYRLDQRGTNIGDFVLYDNQRGLVIERDGTQGNLNGFKAIYEITLREPGNTVEKSLLVDLMNLRDPNGLSLPARAGDVGLGERFSFPFVTIEDVFVLDRDHIGVLNDNNYPFSVGRHVGSSQPDDNEFIIVRLGRSLGR